MDPVSAQTIRHNGHTRSYQSKRRVFILGVRADNIDTETALATLRTFARDRSNGAPARVFFTNVHSIYVAQRNSELMSLVNNADLVLPDGSGLKIAARLFGTPVLENLNGTDLIPKFLRQAESEGLRVFLLGGRPRVVSICRLRLQERYPRLKIVGLCHGYFSNEEEKTIIGEINRTRPHVLLVGMGTPIQEQWISRHASCLNVGVCIGVGGLFDFLSGQKRRSPLWMRQLGVEWLYRFISDPRSKWERVLIEIPDFLVRIIVRRLTLSVGRLSFRGKGLFR